MLTLFIPHGKYELQKIAMGNEDEKYTLAWQVFEGNCGRNIFPHLDVDIIHTMEHIRCVDIIFKMNPFDKN